MTKKIKHIRDLPEWFSLDKYSDAVNLDAAGWYEQLSLRQKNFVEVILIKYPAGDISTELEERIAKRLQSVRAIPIDKSKVKHSHSKGLHLTTVREHYYFEQDMGEVKRTYARNFFHQIYNDKKGFFDEGLEYKYQHG